jgi:methionine-rich copper-binding protein CopC
MNMNRRSILAIALVAATTLSTQAVYAAPSTITVPVHAMFAKVKTVKLSLRNASPAAIELRAGDSVIKIDAGKTIDVSLPAGTRIVTNAPTPHHQTGDVVVEVQSSLNGATIAIS